MSILLCNCMETGRHYHLGGDSFHRKDDKVHVASPVETAYYAVSINPCTVGMWYGCEAVIETAYYAVSTACVVRVHFLNSGW